MPPRKKAKTAHDDTEPAPRRSSRAKMVKHEPPAKSETPQAEPLTKAVAARRRPLGDRHLRVRRGGLADMPNMPLDVLVEIFALLHPRDLLCLARTSRDFRAFLMSREKSIFLWRTARKQIKGLPEPPPPLSEPSYANLMFSNHCHRCLRTSKNVVIIALWRFLVRYCIPCRKEMLVTETSEAMAPIRDAFKNVQLRSLLNSSYSNHSGRYDEWYDKSQVDEVLRLWKSSQKARTVNKKDFVKQRDILVSGRYKLVEQLAKWEDGVVQKEKADKEAVKEAIKEERFAEVLVKLRDEGWDDEISKMGEHDSERLFDLVVTRAVKLTQKGWDTIRASVIEHMESVRAQRLHHEYKEMIKTRLKLLKRAFYAYTRGEIKRSKDTIIYATVTDCAYIPEIRAILEDASPGCTGESVLAQFVDTLPVSIAKWDEDRKADLAALAIKAFGDSDAARAPQPLDLAIALFRCQRCTYDGKTLRFSAVLKHSCVRLRPNPANSRFHEALDSALYPEVAMIDPKNYRSVNTSLMQQDVRCAREVIEACGHDPDRVTFEEMEACEARLRCRICATLSTQKLYSWQVAIEHTLQCHMHHGTEQLPGFWERVPDEPAAISRSLESALVDETVPETDARFYDEDAKCMWCGRHSTVRLMKTHLKDEHGKRDPQMMKDYCLRKKSRKEITMYDAKLYSQIPSKVADVKNGVAFFASF